jgi:rhamnose utilization protein RhaD (predicted bifunctional aldolase and dehydrogenase)
VKNRSAGGAPEGADELDQIVALSNRVGLETSLVQPGGGNTSIKVRREDADGRMEERLLVKGSGTDLRSIGRAGFTRLSMQGLSRLRDRGDMSDQHMMEFMRDCMCDARDPLPSVETPLHSILPYRVIAHTHDVATMSLTNLSDDLAEKLVRELFEGEIFYVPYARPGFPLAQSVLELAPRIPERAIGLTLAHHGLVVWGDDARECYERLLGTVEKVEAYLTAAKKGRRTLGALRVAAASPAIASSCTSTTRRRSSSAWRPSASGSCPSAAWPPPSTSCARGVCRCGSSWTSTAASRNCWSARAISSARAARATRSITRVTRRPARSRWRTGPRWCWFRASAW